VATIWNLNSNPCICQLQSRLIFKTNDSQSRTNTSTISRIDRRYGQSNTTTEKDGDNDNDDVERPEQQK
jgi:hypothetical protein